MIYFEFWELAKQKSGFERNRSILVAQYNANKNELSAEAHYLRLSMYDCEIETSCAKLLLKQHNSLSCKLSLQSTANQFNKINVISAPYMLIETEP
jgi:hypothetical protein